VEILPPIIAINSNSHKLSLYLITYPFHSCYAL